MITDPLPKRTCQGCAYADAKGAPGLNCCVIMAGFKTPKEGCGAYAATSPQTPAKEPARQTLGPVDSPHTKGKRETVMHDAKPAKLEKELQRQCEGWLVQRGYRRMTAEEAVVVAKDSTGVKGWFFHMARPIGNPLCPDLIVFTLDMTECVAVELKVQDVYQVGQREMIDTGSWELAKSFESFLRCVEEWENRSAARAAAKLYKTEGV